MCVSRCGLHAHTAVLIVGDLGRRRRRDQSWEVRVVTGEALRVWLDRRAGRGSLGVAADAARLARVRTTVATHRRSISGELRAESAHASRGER